MLLLSGALDFALARRCRRTPRAAAVAGPACLLVVYPPTPAAVAVPLATTTARGARATMTIGPRASGFKDLARVDISRPLGPGFRSQDLGLGAWGLGPRV